MSWSEKSKLPDPNDAERARARAIRCLRGEVAPIVLLPGDPFRAQLICERYLDGGELKMVNREFHTYLGQFEGVPISVISTGLGSPGAAMVVRDLAALGATAAIRVGTAGSGQSHVQPGDMVVATGAVRDEGLSRHYAPSGYPAVPDPVLSHHLAAAASAYGRVHRGVVHTSDAFQSPVTASEMKTLSAMGVLAYEMEAAAVMVMGALCGIATACILAIDGMVANVQSGNTIPDFDARDRAVDAMIRSALKAAIVFEAEAG
ncbi:MAG: nucleoside phosphorylase [Rhizobiaceae bacterium]|nr:nucleoside phosphorylase [Rhizobiaceae bacterium]